MCTVTGLTFIAFTCGKLKLYSSKDVSVPVICHVYGIWYNNRFLTVNCCTCDHLTAQHLRHYNHSSGKCLVLPPVCIDS